MVWLIQVQLSTFDTQTFVKINKLEVAMFNHEPKNYDCPYCEIAKGNFPKDKESSKDDLIYKDKDVTAFISPCWRMKNKGHVVIITNSHIENLYDLSDELSEKIHKLEKKIALGMKAVYHCDGISTSQQNEPCSGQEVWHYNLHIIPRYEGDNLFRTKRQPAKVEERFICAILLREFIKNYEVIK